MYIVFDQEFVVIVDYTIILQVKPYQMSWKQHMILWSLSHNFNTFQIYSKGNKYF